MTTRILKRYDLSSMDYLESLIERGFKTALEVKKRELLVKDLKQREFQKIANLILCIGDGICDK